MSLLLAAAMATFTITGAHVVDFGIYDAIRVGYQESPNTTQGSLHVVNPRLDPALREKTSRIPARIGVHFGIRFQVEVEPPVEVVPLKVRVLHPEFTNPETGKKSTVEEWDAPVNPDIPRFTGWAFDQPYEAVPGNWVIQVMHDKEILLQKGFVVFNP